MTELEQLKGAIAALEAQRALLGDAVVDTALVSMREKLAALEAQQHAADQQLKYVTILFTDVTGSTQMAPLSPVTFEQGRSGTAEGAERVTLTVLARPNAGETLPPLPPFRPSTFGPPSTI